MSKVIKTLPIPIIKTDEDIMLCVPSKEVQQDKFIEKIKIEIDNNKIVNESGKTKEYHISPHSCVVLRIFTETKELLNKKILISLCTKDHDIGGIKSTITNSDEYKVEDDKFYVSIENTSDYHRSVSVNFIITN
jgi:hypothetical protein